jgi:hypothetical protein
VKIVKFFNSVVLEICMEAVKVGCNDNFSWYVSTWPIATCNHPKAIAILLVNMSI